MLRQKFSASRGVIQMEGSYLISELLLGFLAGVLAAFGCSVIISIILMRVVDFDKPDSG